MADNRLKLTAGLLMMPEAQRQDLARMGEEYKRFQEADYLRKMGEQGVGLAKSVARGVPQMATGLVDLASLPFEAAGVLQPGQAIGSTKWLENKGYLPPPQEGFINQTVEGLSSALDPSAMAAHALPMIAGTFIGKGAKTWDAIQAAEAAKRLEAGEDAAKIWQETKYGIAPWDKEMRSEFSDVGAYSKPQSEWGWASREGMKPGKMETAMGPVSEFYAHPEMEKAYSGLIDFGDADKRLIMRVQPKQTPNASFGDGRITTGLEGDVVPSSSVLHELQHAIQDREGWARGGSPTEFKKEIQNAYDEIENVNTQMSAIVKSMDAAKAAGDTAKYDKYKQMYDEAMDYKLGELVPKAQQDPMQAYQSLAGEAEARLTQARANMTPEQQAAQYPYDPDYFLKTTGVPIDKLISRFDEVDLINKPNNGSVAQALRDYRGSHTAPGPEFGAPLHDLTGGGNMYPDDVYSANAARFYGHGGDQVKLDKETVAIAHRMRNKPDEMVDIYRAVPNEGDITAINAGDWVTINPNYAKQHGESTLEGNYKILSQKVPAKTVWTNADSIHEYGYWPE